MIRAVLDTNIFISALFWRGAPYEVVRSGLESKFTILVSPDILHEIEERLQSKFHYPDSDIAEFLEVITLNSYIVEPETKLDVVRADPMDNKIIECAVAGGAYFIVSGDHHLLDLQKYDGIKVVTARKFLNIL